MEINFEVSPNSLNATIFVYTIPENWFATNEIFTSIIFRKTFSEFVFSNWFFFFLGNLVGERFAMTQEKFRS